MTAEAALALGEAAFEAITKIIETVRAAKAGAQVDPAAVNDAIAKFQAGLTANDASADQALAAKFPGQP